MHQFVGFIFYYAYYHVFVYLCSCTMKTRFYNTSTKVGRTTQDARKFHRPKLTKDVRAAITARRRLVSQSYKSALKDTWGKIDELTKNLAVAHHKSICQVQLELHIGRQVGLTGHKKTSAWNAFCWKKSQEKENGINSLFLFLLNIYLYH
jgi:hypothetical protein